MSKRKLRKEGVENIQLESYQSVKDAINETPNEINFFVHIHLRHYDEQGLGLKQDGMFVDRYGAPVPFHDSWMDGSKAIENALLLHNNYCLNKYTYFPMIGGYAGGAHLYKKYNNNNPWNWTGWIPQQKSFPYNAGELCNYSLLHKVNKRHSKSHFSIKFQIFVVT